MLSLVIWSMTGVLGIPLGIEDSIENPRATPSVSLPGGAVICDMALGMGPHIVVSLIPGDIHKTITTTWILHN